LDEFEAEWTQRDPRSAATLRPPASQAEIDDMVRRLGLVDLPADLVALWTWHDGQDLTPAAGRIAGLWFYSLKEAEQRYRMGLRSLSELGLDRPGIYNHLWLPLFNMRQDSAVAVCDTGEILIHSFQDEDIILGRQPNLASVVRLWLRALRANAWRFQEQDERTIADWDDAQRREIATSSDELAFV
jgi:hypothetical protein